MATRKRGVTGVASATGRGPGRKRAPGDEAPAKKNFRLHQSKIDRAKEVLGTRTETETIEQALELVVFRDRLVEGVRAMSGAGLVSVFDED